MNKLASILLLFVSVAGFSQTSYDGVCSGSSRWIDADCAINDFTYMDLEVLRDTNDCSEVIYIDPSAANGGDGTLGSPFNELSDFTYTDNYAYVLKAGETLNITAENEIPIGVDSVLVGRYGEGSNPIIQSTTQRIFNCHSINATIRDLTLIGPGDVNGSGIVVYFRGASDNSMIYNCEVSEGEYGIFSFGDQLRIVDCYVHNMYRDGIWGSGFDFMEIGNVTIDSVNTAYFVDPTEAVSGGDGIQLEHDWREVWIHNTDIDRTETGNKFCILFNSRGIPTASNSIIEFCTFAGPKFDLLSNGGASIHTNGGDNYLIQYNTFIGSAGSESNGVGYLHYCTNDTFRGNVVYNFENGIESLGSDNIILDHNTLYDNNYHLYNTREFSYNSIYSEAGTATVSGGIRRGGTNNLFYNSSTHIGTDSIVADPLFVDELSSNFALQSGSPAIDQAISFADYAYDINKTEITGTPDIGAYEYVESSQPVIDTITITPTDTLFATQYDTVFNCQLQIVNGDTAMGYLDAGDYFMFNNVDFGSYDFSGFNVRYVSNPSYPSEYIVMLDSLNGDTIFVGELTSTADWNTFGIEAHDLLQNLNGVHNLYIQSQNLGSGNIHWFVFTQSAPVVSAEIRRNGVIVSPFRNDVQKKFIRLTQ